MSPFPKRAAIFALGFCAVTVQVTFFREFLVVFLGNELCAGVVFFSWFFGVGLGAAASARAARRAVPGEGPFILLCASLAAIAPALLVLIRLSRGILCVPPGAYIPFGALLASSAALIAPFSFLVGFAFPFACLLDFGVRKGVRNVGRAYVIESLGSIAGGAAFSFVLVGRVSAVGIVAGCGAAIFLALFFVARADARAWAARATGILAAVWGLALLGGAAGRLESWTVARRWRDLNPGTPLVVSAESRYENIAIGRRAGQYDLFGSGQYYFSFPDPYGAAATAHMLLLAHPAPDRVLLIGGAGGMLSSMLEHRPSRVDYVELDPALIQTVEPYLDAGAARALRDPSVRVRFGDGRRWVKRADERYDLVVLNVPDPSTAMLNRFYTRECYEEVRRILAPGGVVAARLNAPADYYGGEGGDYAGSVYATLRSVFRDVVVAPGEENWFFASADAGAVTGDIGVLRRRWEERGVRTGIFSANHLLSWWLPERVAFTRDALEKARAGARLNTDLRPVTYYYHLILWARFSGSRIISALRALERGGLAWYLGPVLLLWALRLAWLAASGRRGPRGDAFHALLAIGAVGFSAMALELVLIFAFQNVYGYVYRMIGLIVALFMAGLACGGFAATRLASRAEGACLRVLACLMAVLAAHAAAVPAIVRLVAPLAAGSEYAFLSLVMVTGALTGAAFPLAAAVCLRRTAQPGRVAARVNGFDNLGACLGALFAGVVFVPLLGLVSTCLLLAVVNAACAVLLATGAGRAEGVARGDAPALSRRA